MRQSAVQPKFSLILPAYNPGDILRTTWVQIESFAAKHPEWEIIFVCDGCTDGTTETLTNLTQQTKLNIRMISYQPNRGKGFAVRLGMLRARAPYRIFTDVDLAYRMEEVLAVAEQLESGQHVVIASRAHRESEIRYSPDMAGYMRRRKLQSFVFSNLARTLIGVQNRDPQAGLKGLSAQAAETILPRLRCRGFGFDCELLVAAKHFGFSIREVPIVVVYDHGQSTTKFSTSLKMLKELWQIGRRWRKIRRTGLVEAAPITIDWAETPGPAHMPAVNRRHSAAPHPV